MSELDRIRRDLQRARERVTEIEAGKRGVHSGPWQEADGQPGAALAHSAQLQAQRQAVTRFEDQYLMAMLAEGKWTAASIIAAMEPAPSAIAHE